MSFVQFRIKFRGKSGPGSFEKICSFVYQTLTYNPLLADRSLKNYIYLTRQYYLPEEIRYQLRLITGISLGIFLFLLFFLPFEHRELEYNENLLFVIGLAVISFIVMGIFRILLPSFLNRTIRLETYKISNEVIIILLIWIFIALGNIFYLRYVGLLKLSLFTGFKIILFSSFPSVILKIADVNKSLRDQLKHMVEKNIRMERQATEEEHGPSTPELIFSDTQSDKISLRPDDIMLVRSADNYVQIFYRKDEKVQQKMLRKTITNMYAQIRKYPGFIRCHRTCIVNSRYIVSLKNNYRGYSLELLDYEEEIPVSRQYILVVKEYLDSE